MFAHVLEIDTICDVTHLISFTRLPYFFRGAGPGEEGLGTRLGGEWCQGEMRGGGGGGGGEGVSGRDEGGEGVSGRDEGGEGVSGRDEGGEGVSGRDEGREGVSGRDEGGEGVSGRDEGGEGVSGREGVYNCTQFTSVGVLCCC